MGLRKAFGVGFGVAVAVGSMIGAGILRQPADVAKLLPLPSLFLGTWIAGGLYALLGANSLAELGTMVPSSGGQYVFVRRALGPFAGFVVGWNDYISTAGSGAAVAIVVGEALGSLVPALTAHTALTAAVLIAIVTAILFAGARESARAQQLTSLAKSVVLLGLVIACVVGWFGGHVAPITADTPPLVAPTGMALALALVVALQGVIYAYDGWTGILYFSGEVSESARDIPRSLFFGVVAVIALYLLLNIAFMLVLPLPVLAASPLAAASAAGTIFGVNGGRIVQMLIAVALPSAVIANTLMASRVGYALANDGLAPRRFRDVNGGGTPAASLIASSIVALLFLLTGTFERVITICSFLFVASYTLSFASVFVLRRREPEAARPFRAWGHPWSTGFVLLGSILFLVGSIAADMKTGLLAAALAVISYPAFRFSSRSPTGTA